jgi:hypothetical protein
LHYLTAEGAPEFPYVLGNFRQFGQFGQVGKIGGGPARLAVAHPENSAGLVVELHSDVLRRLSLALGLRHCWGTDAALPTSTRR